MEDEDQGLEYASSDLEAAKSDGEARDIPSVVRQIIEARAEFHSGPLPLPSTFAKYDEILPGAAERILALSEAQASHRRDMEMQRLRSRIKVQERGPFFGLTVCLVALCVAAYAVHLGNASIGLAGILAALATLVAPFVVGRFSRLKKVSEEREPESDPG